MARPLSSDAKNRREYCIVCIEPHFHTVKTYFRTGYKALLLKEFSRRFPCDDISIYVLSGKVIQSLK